MMRTFFMETGRLRFSHWEVGDAPLALAIWGDPRVSRYITASGMFSRQEIEARLGMEMAHQETYGVQYWPLFLRDAEEDFLGCCGLKPFPREAGGYETGVQLLPAYWGQGFAEEAERAVIAYAFRACGASALFAGHHPENQGSRKLLAKIGFRHIGERFYPPTGLLHPDYRYVPNGK